MASQAWTISFGIAIGATALEFYELVLVAACLIAPYWAQNHFATLATANYRWLTVTTCEQIHGSST
jgi:hypothetical protein